MENKTHWMASPNKNYLGHWDIPNGEPLTLTIKSAEWEKVTNPITNKTEAKRVVRWKEKDVKPWICNQTNAQTIVRATGIKFMEDSIGQKITLYIASIKDRSTKEDIDCIRVKKETTLPELTPNHKLWDQAKKAVLEGTATISQIKKSYSITTENEKELCN